MPLLRKKPFIPLDLPPDLKADEEVFLNVLTKEIFRDYEEYFKRSILCNSLVWSCEYTGRSNLTLSEALKCESEAADHLQRMPIPLQQGITFILHKNKIASLTSFVEDVLVFYRTRFLIGEEVDISSSGKNSQKLSGVIRQIQAGREAEYRTPSDIVYTCYIPDTESEIAVSGNKICRKRNQLTRERVKLLAKCSAKKISTDPPLYAVKPDHIARLHLSDENLTIPYVVDYGKLAPKVKRKSRDGEVSTPHAKKKKKKTKQKDESECTPAEPRVSPEERRRLIEEERAKKRMERQEEREHQRRLNVAEQSFQREWMKPREDLELTDSTELPIAPMCDTSLPISLYGDVLMVAEFFYLFGEHVDFQEEFPEGVRIGALEMSLISNKHESVFGDVTMFLLKLLFALQEEEDEEEGHFATKYNFTHIAPSLNTDQVPMLPTVGWKSVVRLTPDQDTLPYLGAAQAYFFTDFYLGTPLSKMQLDAYTVTEILRLHILSAGGRNNGQPYYGRWRHNCRGMFSDGDDPCVELRLRDPSLISMLSISNIYDLPPASKLTILSTLINETLTYAQFREIMEDAVDGVRDAKKDWKSYAAEIAKKEKEEAAIKYKEWIASRIKIKEDKRCRKGLRVSELKECDTPQGSDSELNNSRLNEGNETDISLLVADNSEEAPLITTEEEHIKSRERETQLYEIFREVSCKMKVKHLGQDRYYRKYWSFHCVPGLFVEDSSIDISTLYDGDAVSHPDTNGISTTPDVLSATVEELFQYKLQEAERLNGPPAASYSQLQSTHGFSLLKQEQFAWAHYRTHDIVNELIASLNPRGDREKELLDNLSKDKARILELIRTRIPVKRYDPEEMEEISENETDEQKKSRAILKKTSSEKLMEANLREQICDLENRIFEANFGAVKVKNRMSWRQEIEDFWLDDSVKCKMTTGDVPEIPLPIVHQRLMALRASQQSSSQDGDSSTSGSSTVVSRRSIILKLIQALLSVEKGIPAKYLTFPLGDVPNNNKTPKQQPRSGCSVERWRESLSACTSLPQILLHTLALDSSILWGKSILNTNCRICRRKSNPDKILLCDECDRGQHIYCLKPKLKSIPVGKWYCNACRPNQRTRLRRIEISSDEDEEEEEEVCPARKSTLSLPEKLKVCRKILACLQDHEDGWPFLHPVDGKQIPDYYTIIPNPMDLSSIETKFKSNKYRKMEDFVSDVNQIFLNCKHYNTSKAPAYKAGIRLQKLFSTKMRECGLE